MIPRSGNLMVDAEDDAQDAAEKQEGILECGCKAGNCRCDGDE